MGVEGFLESSDLLEPFRWLSEPMACVIVAAEAFAAVWTCLHPRHAHASHRQADTLSSASRVTPKLPGVDGVGKNDLLLHAQDFGRWHIVA